jgi:hypothetical protein
LTYTDPKLPILTSQNAFRRVIPLDVFMPLKEILMANDEKQKAKGQEEAKRKILQYISDQIKQSVPDETIINNLASAGISQENGRTLVQVVRQQMLAQAEKENLSAGSVLVALLAAGVAAILGGLLWGLIVRLTDYEIGYMATGIGLLSGFAIVWFSNRRGTPLQIIAVVFALIGIGIGKYLSFFAVRKDFLALEYGEAAVQGLSVLSIEALQFFFSATGDLFSPYDLLWIVLAVVAAWRILRGVGISPSTLAHT